MVFWFVVGRLAVVMDGYRNAASMVVSDVLRRRHQNTRAPTPLAIVPIDFYVYLSDHHDHIISFYLWRLQRRKSLLIVTSWLG